MKRAIGRLRNYLNAVANKQDYLARLQVAIEHLHDCCAIWLKSVYVEEIFRGELVWHGMVEVFDLLGHPKAKRAYGWSHPDDKDNKTERFVTVLEIPPVVSPETAVKMSICRDAKTGKITPSKP